MEYARRPGIFPPTSSLERRTEVEARGMYGPRSKVRVVSLNVEESEALAEALRECAESQPRGRSGTG